MTQPSDPGIGAFAEPGDQARRDRARFAGPGRPDERDRCDPSSRVANEPFDERVAAEEVGGIGLAERSEALVRISVRRLGRRLLRLRQQRRVMEQDPLLETLQRRRRIEAELVHERRPQLLVGAQRFGVASAAVQGQHEELPGALSQRILADRRVKHRHDLGGPPRLELRGRNLLDRVEVEVVEATDVWLGELLVGEVGEGRPAPQPQRGAQGLGASVGVAIAKLSRPLLDESLEPTRIDRLGIGVELVSGRSRREDLAAASEGLQRPAEVRHVDLDRVRRSAGSAFAPQQVDEPIDRHDLPGMEQQDRQQRTLLRRTEVRHGAVRGHLERAKKAKVHHVRRHRRHPSVTDSRVAKEATMPAHALSVLYGEAIVASLARRPGDSMAARPSSRSDVGERWVLVARHELGALSDRLQLGHLLLRCGGFRGGDEYDRLTVDVEHPEGGRSGEHRLPSSVAPTDVGPQAHERAVTGRDIEVLRDVDHEPGRGLTGKRGVRWPGRLVPSLICERADDRGGVRGFKNGPLMLAGVAVDVRGGPITEERRPESPRFFGRRANEALDCSPAIRER